MLRDTVASITSSMIRSNGKLTLWQETLSSSAAIAPGSTSSLMRCTSAPNSSPDKPPTETIRLRWAVRGR